MDERVPTQEVTVQAGVAALPGFLSMPDPARGLVVFVHGSGSSRFSSRNRFVAEALNAGGLATLLFDLLTADEHAIDAITAELRFDIGLLTERLVGVLDWIEQQSALQALPVVLFGASTGAAAALDAAAERPARVAAMISRGGRPDLATALSRVRAPTLLIVGGDDIAVIGMNRRAAAQLAVEHRLEIVPGATHLFEEPGTLEEVARLARAWCAAHLPGERDDA
ncbi:dienelactone hydrolase family protein [Ectothiorhodospiraceae bacterium 2226]|nr:dienelactone hydrolase family protein [Ectothiorhodospiraceae bacterium 2226]